MADADLTGAELDRLLSDALEGWIPSMVESLKARGIVAHVYEDEEGAHATARIGGVRKHCKGTTIQLALARLLTAASASEEHDGS